DNLGGSNECPHLLMILLARRPLDAAAHIHAIRPYHLDRLLYIVWGKSPSQKNTRNFGYLCCKLPINYLSSPSIGLIRKGVQYESSDSGPPTKLRQGQKRAPILHA